MKHFLTLVFLLGSLSAFTQLNVGDIAPDFTVTDINGTSHTLYDYLNDNKTVIIDFSATWCAPCWDLHQDHVLKDFYDQYGPSGTDQAMVLFLESDNTTTMADLQGTGSATMGDWITGTTYPIIDEHAPANTYGLQFYPTILTICPDKKVKMSEVGIIVGSQLTTSLTACATISTDIKTTKAEQFSLKTFPNPTDDILTLEFNSKESSKAEVKITNALGQVIQNQNTEVVNGKNIIKLETTTIPNGTYFISLNINQKIQTKVLSINH